MEKTEQKYIIIDPASTEFNRGSFCYLPYILYAALYKLGYDVTIMENFTAVELDDIPKDAVCLIAIWSYPQIELCEVIEKFLPNDAQFFGYSGLVELLGFNELVITDAIILKGITNYHKYHDHFKYLLLSDCDMHLKAYEGQVYPFFTSYGCPKGCTFCPSSKNCNQTRLELPVSKVCDILMDMHDNEKTSVHFTDEDFFFDMDRAHEILHFCSLFLTLNLIALGSANSVLRFIKKYGEDILINSGIKLIEVGLETASHELNKTMKKNTVDTCTELAETVKQVNIFWLTMTFFPGETLKSLRATGQFLNMHGFKVEELYSRVASNSTEGGLGQFFQPYPDTIQGIEREGVIITERPIRLIPSFVPHSFLSSPINFRREITENDKKWFELQGLDQKFVKHNELYLYHSRFVDPFVRQDGKVDVKKLLFVAIAARIGVIT